MSKAIKSTSKLQLRLGNSDFYESSDVLDFIIWKFQKTEQTRTPHVNQQQPVNVIKHNFMDIVLCCQCKVCLTLTQPILQSYNCLKLSDGVNARKLLPWESFPSLPAIPDDMNAALVRADLVSAGFLVHLNSPLCVFTLHMANPPCKQRQRVS